jgi:hypothetical protein
LVGVARTEQHDVEFRDAGALRDLVQNHVLQLLALLTMEPPTAFDAKRLRDEKLKVLEAIVPPAVDAVGSIAARAQYGPGVAGGAPVPGYLEEEGVTPGNHRPDPVRVAQRQRLADAAVSGGHAGPVRRGRAAARRWAAVATALIGVPRRMA